MSREKRLELGPGLSVPVDAATESWGFLGSRGSGKSNALVVLAEELQRALVPWVAIDPKGDWWGIRSSADGKSPGLEVLVLGGLHGDLPLEAGMGRVVADLLVDEMGWAVLDVSRMSATGRGTFLTDFCHQLFDRHQADPHVRTVIFEEAHTYIPQAVTSATAALKEATAKIPLEGRAFGLGSATASQRSSRLHKDVLTQFSIMVAMRSGAKLDRDAIGGWVEEHEVSADLLRTLPSLDSGEGWLWSPHALGVAERVRFRRRATFDSGATPKVGQGLRVPKARSEVDLERIGEAMAAAVERAKENDPAELRRRVRELERQLAERPTESVIKVEHVNVVPPKLITIAKGMLDAASRHATEMRGFAQELSDELGRVIAHGLDEGGTPGGTEKAPIARPPRSVPQTRGQNSTPQGDTTVSGAPLKILRVLAQRPERAITPRRVGFLAGYSSRKSTVRNAMSTLRQNGLITDVGDGTIRITNAGLAEVGGVEPLPSGSGLLAHWLAEVGGGAPGRILALMAGQRDLDRDWSLHEIAAGAEIDPDTSTLRNAMSKLRQLGLVTGNHLDPDFVEAIS